jgi:XTP/dITP diphosphohydrolase
MKLVLASNNAKKLAELQALFDGLSLELLPQSALGVAETEEPHLTFIENALAKARHASQCSGMPALADDSGLCVDALGGTPGVQSAVYAPVSLQAGVAREAQRALQDAANNRQLLAALQGQARRDAAFVSVLVAVRHAQDPEPLVATGRWAGRILQAPRGEGGFGYDPLMWINSLQASVAELSAEVKNGQSHRALAAAQMRTQISQAWSALLAP